ncbi:HK97 family phage prohead protease [Phyllobacterium endophyticum]|uniref:HK97 family phage prohead protease n=1 Tax=Phyllobacterium endophyticum TaxID=1149773 RepID=UPI003CCE6FC5
MEAGAFLKSIRTRGAAGIRMLWQHDPNQPIGTWTDIREDRRGLYVEGKLAKGVAKAAEVLELMRSGAIDVLSVRARPPRPGLMARRHGVSQEAAFACVSIESSDASTYRNTNRRSH